MRRLAPAAAAVTMFALLVLPFASFAKEERPFGQGRLFEIASDDRTPSYVFGTMHATDPDVVKLPTAVARAFGRSERLVLELVSSPDLDARMAEAMRLPDGRRLSEIVGQETFATLSQRAAVYGLPPAYLDAFEPWAVSLVFSLPIAELQRSAAGVLALDHALQQAADDRGVNVYALETIDEQIAVFRDLGLKNQVEVLRMTLALNPKIDEMFVEMKNAYLAGDLDHLHDMSRRMFSGGDQRLAGVFEKDFIDRRNRVMAARALKHIRSGGAFIAVGALHLSGERGILRLLEKRGFRVSRVE